jgi:hypothetical protein
VSAGLAWLGIGSLAAGWLLLTDFYLAPDERGWGFVAAGVLLLILAGRRARWRRVDPWLYSLAAPLVAAALVWPMPYRVGPLLILAALLLALALRRLDWLAPLVLGLGLAGAAWIAQGGAAVAAWWLGARYHEASFLAPLVSGLARLLGWNAGSSEGALFLPHVEGPVQATATWERLGLFPVLLIVAGGLALLPLLCCETRQRRIGRLALALAVIVGYVLFRYLVLTAVVGISRDPILFWLPLSMALTFLPLAPLLGRVLALRRSLPGAGKKPARQIETGRKPALRRARYAVTAGLAFIAGLALVGLLTKVDPGRQKAGRVLLDEYNSNWEWTTQVLDTEWYGQKSGYNYYSLGQWLQTYYQVDTNFSPRTPALLAGYDVLIIKTPTAPFAPEELEAIDAWVRAGGGLFLIGDHTNVFGTSSYLNPLARRFGLRFRYDSTYDLPTLRVSLYERPGLLAHPAVLQMPPFLFATSCTLEAPLAAGNVMVGYGLRALPVDYSTRVYFPDKEKEQDYPFGLFLQSAAVQHGRGRVVAFSDSTVFSNFTMFIPGKPEYFLGVMNWLNRSTRWPWLDAALLVVVALAGAGCLYLARGSDRMRGAAAVLGALLLAAALGPWGAHKLAEASYPLPEPHTAYTDIAFEGEHSRLALPTVPAAIPADASYQTFYVWTQRLGYVPSFSETLEEALGRGQVLVLVNPAQPFAPAEMEALEAFVRQGGGLLVLAEPQGPATALANQVLAPFDLSLEARRATTGDVYNSSGEPLGELQVSGLVAGGEPLLTLAGQAPVVALAHYGDGLVAAAAFASPFSDREMGTTSVIPSAHQRFLFDIEFWLLRGLVGGEFPPLRTGDKAQP